VVGGKKKKQGEIKRKKPDSLKKVLKGGEKVLDNRRTRGGRGRTNACCPEKVNRKKLGPTYLELIK